jgi:hypothetical protein
MRLSLIARACAVASLMPVPLAAQYPLPARTFEMSLPVVAPAPVPAHREWWRAGGPRIRPVDDRAAAYLRSGIGQSPRMRQLVHRIEESEVVVYVGVDPRMSGQLAGRVVFVGSGVDFRYLRAMINPTLADNDVVAALAHELQHVVEVIEHPEVTSEAALTALYRRIGHANRVAGVPGWETDAAQAVGSEVRRQMSQASASAALARRQD